MSSAEVTVEDSGKNALKNAGDIDNNVETGYPPVRKLTAGKQYHLFFCYSSSIEVEVRSVVSALESRGLLCCFYERDFVNGKSIVGNIEDLSKVAEGVVFMLTREFIDSRYYLIEVEHCLELKESHQLAHMIPVRLDDCQIPLHFKPTTCIDLSQRSISEAAAEIYKAFLKLDSDRKTQASVGGRTVNQQLQNVRPWFSSRKKVLTFGEKFRADIRAQYIKIPDVVLDAAQRLINSSILVNHRKALSSQLLRLWLVGSLIILAVLFFFGQAAIGERSSFNGIHWSLYVFMGYTLILVILFVAECICFYYWKNFLMQQAKESMRRELWAKFNKTLLHSHKALLILNENELWALQLDITPCKETFQRKVRANPTLYNYDDQRETEEDFTNRMFTDWLEQNYQQLLVVASRRKGSTHTMVNGALCPCTRVNDYSMASTNAQGVSGNL